MKYADKISAFIGDKGCVYGSTHEGFTFKLTHTENSKIEEIGDDFVVLYVEKGDLQGYWYCPLSKFFIHTP
jgi:hypothetical protein